ncbi:putative sugar isomerase YihS [compost metagenome]
MKMTNPDFRSAEFLLDHIRDTMKFYHPRCIDWERGGFYQFFRDNGDIYDRRTRHLVSSTRFVFNYAMASAHLQDDYSMEVKHGLDFLRRVHRNPQTGGYAWLLEGDRVVDGTNHCYGLAFVLLAYAVALKAGCTEAKIWLEETWDLMEAHFWDSEYGLYRDEINADWSVVSLYRGQNANMHSCEALLTAFEATGDKRYLDRARTLAYNIVVRQAGKANDLMWEHYDEHWEVDWDYNRENPRHLFRPWGYQAGHLTEWTKLLLILERHLPEDWMLPRARALFETALARAWDSKYGGICYGFAPSGEVCDGDKYFWVQAESLAAAALLAERTGDECYWDWYDRLWAYAWVHLVDHEYGAWFRILSRENRKYDDLKSPAGKTDYHTMGACYEVLNVLNVLKG